MTIAANWDKMGRPLKSWHYYFRSRRRREHDLAPHLHVRLQHTNIRQIMKFPQEESRAAALSIAMSARRTDKATKSCPAVRAHHEGEPIWTPEFQVAPPIAVLHWRRGRWVAQIIGVARRAGARRCNSGRSENRARSCVGKGSSPRSSLSAAARSSPASASLLSRKTAVSDRLRWSDAAPQRCSILHAGCSAHD